MRGRRSLAAVLALLISSTLAPTRADAAEWPERPLRLIVPGPAGGAYDHVARPVAEELSRSLKQPVIIDNRPSAGAIVSTRAGADAAPDGYTLTITGTPNAIADSLYEQVPYDIVTAFEHVGGIGETAQWLMVRSDAGIPTFDELIARARRDPGRIDYASTGVGGPGHLMMEQLQRVTGIRLTHVPYKGTAPALQDLMAGVVALTVLPPNTALPAVRAGRLIVLAVSGPARSALASDAPTFAELGYPQLTVSAWMGLSAPKGTPAAIVQRLNAALCTALEKPAVAQRLRLGAIEPMPTTPTEYARLVRDDTRRWGEFVRSLRLKPN